MANNSISAANTVGDGNAASNVAASAANASNAAGNVSNATSNTSGSGRSSIPAWASDFCNTYGDILLYTALAFLLFALLLAVGNGLVALRREWNSAATGTKKESIGDPAKFIDSLKALIEALAKAPAWFAMFLGAALLLWIAKDLAERACVPEQSSSTSGSSDANGAGRNGDRPGTPRTDPGGERTPPKGNAERPAAQTKG